MRAFTKKALSVIAALTVAASMNGVTTFADMATNTEDTAFGMGGLTGVVLDENGNAVRPDLTPDGVMAAGVAATDNYFNLYDEDRVSPVRNQGDLETCWAHAALAAAESNMITKGYANESIDYSEAHLAWFANGAASADTSDPLYNDAGKKFSAEDAYMRGGVIYDSIGALTRWSGAQLEANAPYSAAEYSYGIPAETQRYASYAHLQNVEIYDSSDLTSIKNALIKHGALAAFYDHESRYYNKTSAAYYSPESGTNHVITIVGWDDNFSRTNFNASYQPESNGAWIAKNSWGDTWGKDGLFYISYEDASLHDIASYDMEKTSNYNRIYQYDASIGLEADGDYVYYRGMKYQNNSTNANVYTAKASDALAAVGFYTGEADVSYTITVYTDVKTTPTSGTVALTQSGTFAYAGYHTVKLSNEIELTEGTKFAVAITFYGYGYAFYDNYSTGTGLSYFAATTTPTSATTWTDNHSKYGRSACIKAYTKPRSQPKNVKASADNGSVTLTWSAVSGATKYRIRRNDGTSWKDHKDVETNRYTDTYVLNGKKYYYAVYACVDGVWSSASAIVNATPVVPVAQNVKITAGNGRVDLSWEIATNAIRYRIRRNDGTGWVNYKEVTTTSFSDTAVTNGTTYYYAIYVYSGVAWGKASAIVSAMPINSIVQNVKATAGSDSITLTWNPATKATKYRVRRNDGSGWVNYKDLTSTTLVDTSVAKGQKYYYAVYSYINGTWSTPSDIVNATIPVPAVQNVKAASADAKVTLTWSKVTGATKYRIRRNDGTGWVNYKDVATNSFADTQVTNGSKYYYAVYAYANGTWSAASAIVSGTPVRAVPENLTATGGNSWIVLIWDKVEGATKYRIRRNDGTCWENYQDVTNTYFVDTDVLNGSKYYYAVYAMINGTWNSPSLIVSAVPGQ